MPAPSPETVARVRADYLRGVPASKIEKDHGVSNRQLYDCIDGRHDDGSGTKPQPLPRRSTGRVREPGTGSADPRSTLTGRLWRAAERQVRGVEKRLRAAGLAPSEHESGARTLAVLVKTLRDLSAFDAAAQEKAGESANKTKKTNDDSVPADVDELRRELARRINEIIAERDRD